MAEANLRKSLIMYEGSWSFLYGRPIALAFILFAVFSVYSTLKLKQKERIALEKSALEKDAI